MYCRQNETNDETTSAVLNEVDCFPSLFKGHPSESGRLFELGFSNCYSHLDILFEGIFTRAVSGDVQAQLDCFGFSKLRLKSV